MSLLSQGCTILCSGMLVHNLSLQATVTSYAVHPQALHRVHLMPLDLRCKPSDVMSYQNHDGELADGNHPWQKSGFHLTWL